MPLQPYSPYYFVPDGEVGQPAFAVIRGAIRKEGMVALGRVVFTSREHTIALEPRGKGLLGVTLRYPFEVRKEDEYFHDIADEKIPKDMLELASHIVETKSGHFKPDKFEDHYEDALNSFEKTAVWSEDRSTKRACPGESDQSHGCATPKRGGGAWWRWARRTGSGVWSDSEESCTIERTQENRLAVD